MLTRLLRAHLAPYARPLTAVASLQLVGAVASLYLPSMSADIIDRGIATGDVPHILRTGGWMLLVSVLQMVCLIAAVSLGARAAMGFGRDLRAAIFRRVGEFSGREIAGFGVSSLITRSTNDVQQVQNLVLMTCTMLVAAPIMCVGGVITAVREDPGLAWVMAVSLGVLTVAVVQIARRMLPRFRAMQVLIDGVNRVLREQIIGIRVVRAFVREGHEAERFARANAELTRTARRAGRSMALLFPIVMLVLNVSGVAVVWFGAVRADAGQIQIGTLTAFLSYLLQILMSVMMAAYMLLMVPRAAACAERVMQVLDAPPSVAPAARPVTELRGPGDLELRAVRFQYPGAARPVLGGITFRAEAGRTTAVIGGTGSGKTTLVSLVPRLLDVTGGSVLVDGVDVRDLDQELLWSRIGLVPQKPYLFSGTVATNLRHGRPDATAEELWAALEVAQARDFVASLPGGLDAPIAQGGTNVSGGQRQRLAIARAVVKRPRIYLFDDAFSALDSGTDARLRAALRPVTADAAVVVVAQRVSTIVDADQIVVLEDGAIAGIGTHGRLLETCPTYAEIAESQLMPGPVG
ncbi:multidrug ABC transporter ATP-binding protein [Sphaerisporangium krabiense]|uniref:ATP-binding cassette subfamily B protein n=1 Tax=Sphaerisporangium krabiense TaxID=763782 RepID=A0A7W9DQG1_9ACTN|nr:ABC transporter ATP-binding protein [Sphaerisporangium krabiense]MBB5627502.1 ATP-binding cassette subfamily B protein [Sphaerisporangium krabiense]GII64359.1 multidrug ABC transporter ATP-binding protein [Sphaerisporangium krabiense]